MGIKRLSCVLCLLSFLSLALGARAGMSLTYSASLGEAVGGDAIAAQTNLTANAEMTVTLYPSQESDTPLWRQCLAADIVAGRFSVVLTDSDGSLEKLFARADPADALWVEVSNIQTNGLPLAGMTGALPRGRIAAAPFAIVADRAAGARNGFRVRGTATVMGLESIGNFETLGTTAFSNTVTFARQATFGAGGLSVIGTVSKTNLEGIGTLTADTLVAAKHIEVGALTLTNGVATTLSSSPTGFVPPAEIRVAGTLAVGETLTTTNLTTECLTVGGGFTVEAGGTLIWDGNGTLTVPGGVYEADSENANLTGIFNTGDVSYENTTGRNALLTYTVGAQYSECQGTITHPAGTTNWVYYGSTASIGVNVTTLYPLAQGDKAAANHVFTRYVKELSK